MDELELSKERGDSPHWLSEEGWKTLAGSYLLPGETPRAAWSRISNAAASTLKRPDLASKFFDLFWNNWLCAATPVLANLGTERGLPISCNSLHVSDNTDDIFKKNHELAMLSKYGAGVGIYIGDIRPKGTKISKGGTSDGVVPWAKVYDSTTLAVNQGGVRRGASALYLPVDHGDIEEFVPIRRQTGDLNRRTHNIHHAVCISDDFMNRGMDGDKKARQLWSEILTTRFETGEPYLMFRDTINRANPACYKENNLNVSTSNICLEGKTEVLTKDGPVPIESLVDKTVTLWDGREWVENSKFRKTGCSKLYRLWFEEGCYVECTPYHKWPRKSEFLSYEMVETTQLVEGDQLETHSQGGSSFGKIYHIEKLEGTSQVYCTTVPTTAKFALANGLMTGNCLAEETLITTRQGLRPIGSLVGVSAQIWDGAGWVENSNFIQTSPAEELYRVTLGDGSFVDCTAKHRWPVLGTLGKCNRFVEKTTDQLLLGDRLEFHNIESHGEIKEPSAYLKGFLLAEGTADEDKPKLWIYHPKFCLEGRLIRSLAETPCDTKLRSDCITVPGVTSGDTRRHLQGLTARKTLLPWATSFKRKLPDTIYEWSEGTKREFLAGFFDGDGCALSKGGYQIASIHEAMLRQVQTLLKTLGVRSTLRVQREARVQDFKDGYGEYPCSRIWRLTVSPRYGEALSRKLEFSRLAPQTVVAKFTTSGFRKVTSIEKLEGLHPVYCTNVPTTHKFALGVGVTSLNCSEITLYTDPQHTFVCCLSSMNLLRWEEWKDTDAIQLSIWFLDAVLSEYIRKIEEQGIPGFEPALLSARKGRAIGLGVLGWHSLLQARSIPFDSFESMFLNSQIFRKLQSEAEIATRDLALAYGEPEWCKGHGRRNTHLIAVAPTVSNSIISGSVSPGIEPIAANVFSLKTSKGVFIRKNLLLEKLLADRGENTPEVWNQVIKDNGSVSSLKCMTDHEKEVFQTALEINQFAIIKQASQRQKWIDQAQSLNLFFGINSDPQYIQNCHIQAWKDGIKTLYYLRAESALKGDNVSRQADECRACEA